MPRKKKYLVISEVFYPEEFLVNDLVFELKNQGVEVEVLTRTPSYPYGKTFKGYKNKLFQKNIHNGVTVNRVSIVPGYANSKPAKMANYIWFVFATTWFILCKGRKYQSYLVYQTGPLTVAIPGVIGKKLWGKKLLVYTQDVWPDSVYAYGFKKRKLLVKLLNAFVGWVYRNTSTILVSCKGFASKIAPFAKNKDIVFVPNWIPASFEVQLSSEELAQNKYNAGINFTFAGNIGKVQNLENIIEGFFLFQKQQQGGAAAYLNIIGDGSNLQDLKNLVELQAIPNVVFWGRKPMASMPSFFAQSNALIISLIDKPIFALTVPSKFQAYLSAEKPIFCAMDGEVAELVKENGLGVVSPPSAIAEIAKGFSTLAGLSAQEYDVYVGQIKAISKSQYDRKTNINKIAQLVTSTT